MKTKGGVYYKAWNCRERQKGQKGNGCRCRLISEESLIAEIVKALGWETMDEGRFGREVSRVLVSDDDVLEFPLPPGITNAGIAMKVYGKVPGEGGRDG